MYVRAAVYATFAALGALWILQTPNSGSAPGTENLDPLVPSAMLSAVGSYLLLLKFRWLPFAKSKLARGALQGAAVVLGAHVLLGPVFVVGASLIRMFAGAHVDALTDILDATIAISLLSLFYIPITIAAGVVAGIVGELLAGTITPNNPVDRSRPP